MKRRSCRQRAKSILQYFFFSFYCCLFAIGEHESRCPHLKRMCFNWDPFPVARWNACIEMHIIWVHRIRAGGRTGLVGCVQASTFQLTFIKWHTRTHRRRPSPPSVDFFHLAKLNVVCISNCVFYIYTLYVNLNAYLRLDRPTLNWKQTEKWNIKKMNSNKRHTLRDSASRTAHIRINFCMLNSFLFRCFHIHFIECDRFLHARNGIDIKRRLPPHICVLCEWKHKEMKQQHSAYNIQTEYREQPIYIMLNPLVDTYLRN